MYCRYHSLTGVAFACPTEHSFGYDHQRIDWTDAWENASYYVNPLNTTNSAQDVHDSLILFGGYSNNSWFLYDSASSLQTSIGSDAVFFVNAHGAPGKIIAASSNDAITYLTANTTGNSRAYSLEYKYQNTTDKLDKVRFAYYVTYYGYTLSSARISALSDVLFVYGSYGGTNSSIFDGEASSPGSVKLTPAAYGI